MTCPCPCIPPSITSVLIHTIEVTVIFEMGQPPRVSLPCFEPPCSAHLRLAPGIHLIRFVLTNTETDVIFPSSPVLWVDEHGGTTLQPPGLLVHWFDAKQAALVVFNAVGAEREFLFRVTVNFQNQIFSSMDPTIICDPPGS